MELDELNRRLIAAARANPPSDMVPLAFEKRIMAGLRSRPGPDAWDLWTAVLWRAVAPCLGLTLLLSTWAWLYPASQDINLDSVDSEVENHLLAAFHNPEENW